MLLSISFISKAQSEKELQNHLISIERKINSNSIDTLFLDFHIEEEPVKIIAFYQNELLLMIGVNFLAMVDYNSFQNKFLLMIGVNLLEADDYSSCQKGFLAMIEEDFLAMDDYNSTQT